MYYIGAFMCNFYAKFLVKIIIIIFSFRRTNINVVGSQRIVYAKGHAE